MTYTHICSKNPPLEDMMCAIEPLHIIWPKVNRLIHQLLAKRLRHKSSLLKLSSASEHCDLKTCLHILFCSSAAISAEYPLLLFFLALILTFPGHHCEWSQMFTRRWISTKSAHRESKKQSSEELSKQISPRQGCLLASNTFKTQQEGQSFQHRKLLRWHYSKSQGRVWPAVGCCSKLCWRCEGRGQSP